MAACMTVTATGATSSFEIHSKLQVQRRISYLEHKSRQADGSLMTTNVTLLNKASPIIAYTTHDVDTITLGADDKQAVTDIVFTQPAVGLTPANTKITCTFATGFIMKGDLVGGDAPDSEAEQQFLFISDMGEGVWAEAA